MMPSGPVHGRGCDCPRCEHRRAYQRFYRSGQRVRAAAYTPTKPNPDVRTYGHSPTGFDYDAAIRAAALSAVPLSESPNRGTRR